MPGAILTERQKRLWVTAEYEREILERQALKRMLLPEEVARLVLFLGAEDSSAITNQSYVVDGGWVDVCGLRSCADGEVLRVAGDGWVRA